MLVIGVTIVANESCFIIDSLNIPRGGYYGMASPPQILKNKLAFVSNIPSLPPPAHPNESLRLQYIPA